MKFSKMITVTVEAEPTSEEWYMNLMDANGTINTPHFATYEEAFNAVPTEFKDITRRAFAQPLNKKYKNAPKQFWTLNERIYDEDWQQVCICHYYHFDCDFSTHVEF